MRAGNRGQGALTPEDAAALDRCLAAGGVALFPADTVYGLGADPESPAAVERLYEIKGRPADRPAAVMLFDLDAALAALPELGQRTRAALLRLLPGAITAIVPNPAHRYPLACGPTPEHLGLRVPLLDGPLAPLRGAVQPLLQSSANRSGAGDAARIEDVDPAIRERVDLELDGGELPGVPSTVVDLTAYEQDRSFAIPREGAVGADAVRTALLR